MDSDYSHSAQTVVRIRVVAVHMYLTRNISIGQL